MPVTIEKQAWGGWPNCYRIANDAIELILTSDIGPRIMHCGFLGSRNFFKVFEDQMGKSGEPDWQFRGGHRVWLAPEDRHRTYQPDNLPAEIQIDGNVVTATQQVEPVTGLRKQLVIRVADAGAKVEVEHRMQNTLPTPVTVSAWVLTMLAPGGTAVTGFPPRGSHAEHLAPTNPLVMWAFTDLRDPRWTFLEKYLVLRHDPANQDHTKLGHFNTDTWGAYLLGSELFLKSYRADSALPYPDMGCSYETFASADMLEIETLGPLTVLQPGEWVSHTENWWLHRGVSISEWTDQGLDSALLPLLAARSE